MIQRVNFHDISAVSGEINYFLYDPIFRHCNQIEVRCSIDEMLQTISFLFINYFFPILPFHLLNMFPLLPGQIFQ